MNKCYYPIYPIIVYAQLTNITPYVPGNVRLFAYRVQLPVHRRLWMCKPSRLVSSVSLTRRWFAVRQEEWQSRTLLPKVGPRRKSIGAGVKARFLHWSNNGLLGQKTALKTSPRASVGLPIIYERKMIQSNRVLA